MADVKHDLIVNVVAPKNRNVWFYPLQKTIRGDKRISEAQGTSIPGALLQIGGTIPGQQLRVNTKTREVALIDKMSLPENSKIDKDLRRLTQTDRYRSSSYGTYEQEETWKIAHKDWPTFLYHVRNLVQNGRFIVSAGEKSLPDVPEILEMGDVQLGDTCNVEPKNKEQPFYMANKEHFGGVPLNLAKVGA